MRSSCITASVQTGRMITRTKRHQRHYLHAWMHGLHCTAARDGMTTDRPVALMTTTLADIPSLACSGQQEVETCCPSTSSNPPLLPPSTCSPNQDLPLPCILPPHPYTEKESTHTLFSSSPPPYLHCIIAHPSHSPVSQPLKLLLTHSPPPPHSSLHACALEVRRLTRSASSTRPLCP